MRSRSFKPIKVGIEVYQFEVGHRKVWQVWFDGASASGYFRTPEEANEEAKLIETEIRLGGVRHSRDMAQWWCSPAMVVRKGALKWSREEWLPMKRKKGSDPFNEGDEDL